MIVSDVIKTAYYDIGVIPIGETPSSDFNTIALAELNAMLKLFVVEGLMLNAFSEDILILTSSKASYTISTDVGSDLLVARPSSVHSAFIRVSSQDYNIEVYNSMNKYNEYALKSTKGMPTELFYNPTYPKGTIYLYPTPDSAYSLYLTSEKQLTSYVLTTEDTLLPAEYEMMLSKNLAKILMSKFGKYDAHIVQMADSSKETIMLKNSKLYIQESKFETAITYSVLR